MTTHTLSTFDLSTVDNVALPTFNDAALPRAVTLRSIVALSAGLLLSGAAHAQASTQPATSSTNNLGSASQPAAIGASSQPASFGAASQPASVADESRDVFAPTTTTEQVVPIATSPDASMQDTSSVGDFTSRPGASETASVLPPGGVLLQSGLDFSSSGILAGNTFDETRSLSIPDLVLRVGLLDFLEVRASARLAINADLATAFTSTAIEGYRLGIMFSVVEESTFVPAMALALSVDVPLPSLRYEAIGGEARLALSKGFFDIFGVGGNVAAGWDGANGDPTLAWTLVATGALSDSITPYVETFGDYKPLPGNLPTVWVDAGASWSVSRWIALDAFIGINVFGEGLSYFAGVGASFYFPGHLFLFDGPSKPGDRPSKQGAQPHG